MPNSDANEPSLGASQLEQRCKKLASELCKVIGLNKDDVLFAVESFAENAFVSTVGRSSEVVQRNRGPKHRVFPICEIANGVHAWLGFSEKWVSAEKKKSYLFECSNFTMHIGKMGEVEKPQVLRSEWVGRRNKSFDNLAGHPHWQMDVLESARGTSTHNVRFEAIIADSPKEFETAPSLDASQSLLEMLTLERIHLASSAQWWLGSTPAIAHAPRTVKELDSWVLGCAAYLIQEVKRCDFFVPAR